MYNEELEMLIDAALADGILTDKEKQILFRKAQSLGIDLDEFSMVLEGRLVKIQEAKRKEGMQPAPKSNKFGEMKRCPSCGAPVAQFQAKCPECGYEFRDLRSNTTVLGLQKALDDIDNDYGQPATGKDMLLNAMTSGAIDRATKKKIEVIKNYPIPNTKEDLIEMLTLCQANAHYDLSTPDQRPLANAWRSKLYQIQAKAQMLLKDDNDAKEILESINKDRKARTNKKRIIIGIIVAFYVALFIAVFLM